MIEIMNGTVTLEEGRKTWKVDAKGNVRPPLLITLQSHGLKTTTPAPKADLYLDCRGVREPDGIPGEDPEAQALIKADPSFSPLPYLALIEAGIKKLPTRRRGGEKAWWDDPFHIVTLCAWGMNRSPAMKHILADELNARGWNAKVIGWGEGEKNPLQKYTSRPTTPIFIPSEARLVRMLSPTQVEDLAQALQKRIDTDAMKESKEIGLTEGEIAAIKEDLPTETVVGMVKKRLPSSTRQAIRYRVWAEEDRIQTERKKGVESA